MAGTSNFLATESFADARDGEVSPPLHGCHDILTCIVHNQLHSRRQVELLGSSALLVSMQGMLSDLPSLT